MSPGNPKHHAPWLLCRFLHDLLALKRPSRKWGPGGNWVGCKMACFGWNTHPSAQGSSTLTPLSPQDSPLDLFRGVSSCEGPGGQTWKNTCKERIGMLAGGCTPVFSDPHIMWVPHPWRYSKRGWRGPWAMWPSGWQLCPQKGVGTRWSYMSLPIQPTLWFCDPRAHGSTHSVPRHPDTLQVPTGNTRDFSTLMCPIGLQAILRFFFLQYQDIRISKNTRHNCVHQEIPSQINLKKGSLGSLSTKC